MTVFPSPEQLIPHAAPMVLLSRVCANDGVLTTCIGEIGDATPGLVDGRVSTTLCLELMAQCAAVQVGLGASDAGDSPQIGMLVSCRELRLESAWLLRGDAFRVEVRQIDRIEGGLTAFEGKVSRATDTIAAASFSVYMPQPTQED